jgi:hypothetical protein
MFAEIVFEKGSFPLPCDTPNEREWLVSEINAFLKQVPPQRYNHERWPPLDVEGRLRRIKQFKEQELRGHSV